jgi:hypothetical protein
VVVVKQSAHACPPVPQNSLESPIAHWPSEVQQPPQFAE